MAQVEKFTKAQAARWFSHAERKSKTHMNKSIDRERSGDNYRLAPFRLMTDKEYYSQRLEKLRVWKRADVNTLCSWVVTLPKDVKPEDERRFFNETMNFIAERFGRENIVSGWVHKDETTPHCHIAFIPTPDGKKVSAKEVINLKELTVFHDEFQKHMDATGIEGAKVKTGYTKANGGNRSVKQMKRDREHGRDHGRESRGVFR